MRVLNDLRPVRDDEAMTIPLDLFGDGFIFDDLVFDFFMSADGIVDCAPNHDELSICDCITSVWVVDLARGEADRERGHHERHDNFFPERAEDLFVHGGEHICLGFDGFGITG